jgi:hypothetical protein
MADLTTEAFRIADEAMWIQARSHAQVIGGKLYFVGNYPFPARALVTACPELKEAFGYLRDRGYVELARDDDGEFMRLLASGVQACASTFTTEELDAFYDEWEFAENDPGRIEFHNLIREVERRIAYRASGVALPREPKENDRG